MLSATVPHESEKRYILSKMKRRNAIASFVGALFLSIISSRDVSSMPIYTLTKAQASFAFALFAKLLQQNPSKNVVVSPVSIYLALCLLYNGTQGVTAQEMAKLLGSQEATLDYFNKDLLKFQNSLSQADDKVTLKIANSLWVKNGISVYPRFLESLKSFYKATITNLDFKNPQSVAVINQWVAQQTNNKIKKIIDKISPEQVMILINAIYFKGLWTKAFDAKLTTSKSFTLLNGSTKNVSMMSRQDEYLYLDNNLLQMVSIPYGKGNFSLDIFLPKKGINFQTFLKEFSLENCKKWLSQLKSTKGTVEIPRFKLEYEITLNSILQSLGMQSAFMAGKANFSQLTRTPVKVDEVKHKTYIEVNEEGTEAAAVTSIGIRATSIMPENPPFIFLADRPFICILRERQTDSFLFMGTIVEPK